MLKIKRKQLGLFWNRLAALVKDLKRIYFLQDLSSTIHARCRSRLFTAL